jgi:hypothetical protein
VGKKNTKITVITRYRCVQNANADSSAWTQQKIYMRDRKSKASPDLRKQFVTDLIAFINAKQASDHEIILNLDANEVLGEESKGIAKILQECDMVDLLDKPDLKHKHQLKDTYRRGSNRCIDFMLGTPQIQTSVHQSGALEYNDGILLDHRGLYVDLDPVILFGGMTDDPVSASSRGFTSKK